MTFEEFNRKLEYLTPPIENGPNSPGFVRNRMIWNSLAVLFPDQCEDVVRYDYAKPGIRSGFSPPSPNPFRDDYTGDKPYVPEPASGRKKTSKS